MEAADLTDRWAQIGRGESIAPPVVSTVKNTYFKPLADTVPEYIQWATTPQDRIYFGFQELDEQVRGIGKGEMCLINGYSHSGKTLFLMEVLLANRDKVCAYFCPDEPKTLTLIKLACLVHRVPGRELENMIISHDPKGLEILESTVKEHFPKLAVFDQFMSLSDMEKALDEVTNTIGAPALMVYDYLDLLGTGDEGVPGKATTIKAFGARRHLPLIVLHQSSRTSGSDGKKQTISSGAYGGEQQATHIIGVRRKKFEIEGQMREIQEKIDRGTATEKLMERLDTLRYDLVGHDNTLTLNLVKCKRQDASLVDDMDYDIEHGTGRLRRVPGPYGTTSHTFNAAPSESFKIVNRPLEESW